LEESMEEQDPLVGCCVVVLLQQADDVAGGGGEKVEGGVDGRQLL
jgi:hypothetical protein